MLNTLVGETKVLCESKQFNYTEESILAQIAWLHAEVSEVMEAYKKGHDKSNMKKELADVIIKTCTIAGILDVRNLEQAVADKMTELWKRAPKSNVDRSKVGNQILFTRK